MTVTHYTKEEQQLILLGSAPKMTAPKFNYLLNEFKTPAIIWENITQKNPAINFLGQELITYLLNIKNNEYAKEYFKTLKAQNITALCPLSPSYPQKFFNIEDAPPILFVKGDPHLLNKTAVSIVGSRKCTRYGRDVAKEFGYELARHGVVVVSGMAKGIDAEAHKGALEAENGQTVAVLGCGVDVCYPAENADIFKSIPKHGALVSEFANGTIPYQANFPRRNRIISALADIVIVVEAGLKSGALITVQTAISQGKEVRCVPGNIHSPNSLGVNSLIQDGARVAVSPEQILNELGIHQSIPTKKAPTPQLNVLEQRIYDLLFDSEKSADELSAILQMEAGELNSVLTMLELSDIVKQLPGRIFSLNR